MEEQEIWKDVVGYEGLYKISSFGRIISTPKLLRTPTVIFLSKPREISQHESKGGYLRVGLTKNRKQKLFFVHRLVAEAFIGVQKEMTINHKDENKRNNHIDNLEYMTRADNVRYGTGIERSAKKRREHAYNSIPVNQYTLDGVFVAHYKCGMDAKRALNSHCNSSHIMECCRRKRHTVSGFIWRFDGDTDLSFTKKTNARHVVQLDLNGNVIAHYPSLEEACQTCHLRKSHIVSCCRGRKRQTGGFMWKYNK